MFIYLFIYNINIHKTYSYQKISFATFNSYIYIIIIKISRNTIKSLSLANYTENNIL